MALNASEQHTCPVADSSRLSRSSTGGCRGGSEPSRGGPSVRHRPSHSEEDAELFVAAGLPPDEAGQAAQAGRVHRRHIMGVNSA